MIDGNEPESWVRYQKHILAELVRHGKELTIVNRQISELRTDVALLRFKSGMWGAAASIVVSVAFFLVYHFKI